MSGNLNGNFYHLIMLLDINVYYQSFIVIIGSRVSPLGLVEGRCNWYDCTRPHAYTDPSPWTYIKLIKHEIKICIKKKLAPGPANCFAGTALHTQVPNRCLFSTMLWSFISSHSFLLSHNFSPLCTFYFEKFVYNLRYILFVYIFISQERNLLLSQSCSLGYFSHSTLSQFLLFYVIHALI